MSISLTFVRFYGNRTAHLLYKVLSSEEAADCDINPFAKLDGGINIVDELAKETSETDMVSIKAGFFDPLICYEPPDNWEGSFFFTTLATLNDLKTATTMLPVMKRFKN